MRTDEVRKNLKMDQKANSRANKQLTNDQRQAILQALLANYEDGKLKRGAIKKVAEIFNFSRNCIGQVWKRANESIEAGGTKMDVRSRKTNCGRKRKEINMDQVVSVPLSKRGTIRSTAEALKIPKSTLFNHIRRGEIQHEGKSRFSTKKLSNLANQHNS